MAVKIKLLRMGKIRAPYYRIVVADARTKRDGRAIETIGKYHPTLEPSLIQVDSERAQYWLSVGAQPTEPVQAILKVTGDWQRFKGLPGAEGTLRVAEPKVDKKSVFEAAALASAEGSGARKKTAPRAEAAPAETPPAQAPTAEAAPAQAPTAEAAPAQAPTAEAAPADAPEDAAAPAEATSPEA